MYPFAVGTDPGRTVTDAPLVLLKTFRTNLKAAGTAPAERFFLLAAMTPVAVFSAPSSLTPFFRCLCTHCLL